MNIVILAGGMGTRLEEETRGIIPKPMVDIGGRPILDHIIGLYRSGIPQDRLRFGIATGYLGEQIENWLKEAHPADPDISAVFTGIDSQTGGRLMTMFGHFGRQTMAATYGDGLTDLNFNALIDHHRRMRAARGVMVTLTAVQPPSRFGSLIVENGIVSHFAEKSPLEDAWINGGFYLIEPEVFERGYVLGQTSQWESDVLPILAQQGLLAAFKHPGWWHMCDTPRDLAHLRELAQSGSPPWERWINP